MTSRTRIIYLLTVLVSSYLMGSIARVLFRVWLTRNVKLQIKQRLEENAKSEKKVEENKAQVSPKCTHEERLAPCPLSLQSGPTVTHEKCNEPAPKCSAVSHFSASMKHNSVSLTSLSSLDSPKFAPVLQSPSSVHPALTLPSKCVSLPRVVSSAAPAPISNPPRNDMWDLMKNCRRLLKTREGFDLCVFFVRNNESKCFMDTLGDADKLALYGAYKQAVFGPCTTPMPAGSEVVARAKWSSWTQLRDVSCDDARRLYIQLLRRMRRVWIAECSALDRSSNSRMSPPVDDNLRKKQARLMYLSFLDYIE